MGLIAVIALQFSVVRILPECPVEIRLIIVVADPDGILVRKAFDIGAVGVGGCIENGLYPVVFFQQLQHFPDILLCSIRIRHHAAQGLIEFHVDHRRQGVFRHRDGLDEVFRLRPAAVLEPEKVVCAHIDLRRLRRFPVLGELAVVVVDALGGFDKAEVHALGCQHIPVDVPLVVGQIDPSHRIILLAGHICRLPSGTGEIDMQQPFAAHKGERQPRKHQQGHDPAENVFSVMFSSHEAISPITMPRPSVQK